MESRYIHGFSPHEQNRLSQLQAIINDKQIALMKLDGVKRILDVGSGLGQMALRFVNELKVIGTPDPKVIGVERDQRQLDQCRNLHHSSQLSNLEFRQGDATSLPLAKNEWNSFDLVHCRFVLEHCPNPESIMTQVAKAVRDGGQVFILDDDHELLRLSPDCHELSRLWEKYWMSYRVLNCDPLIGRRIPQLCGEAGLEVADVNTLFFGATKGEPLFELVVDNMIRVIDSAREMMLANAVATEQDFNQTDAAVVRWRKTDNATVWYSLPYTRALRV